MQLTNYEKTIIKDCLKSYSQDENCTIKYEILRILKKLENLEKLQ